MGKKRDEVMEAIEHASSVKRDQMRLDIRERLRRIEEAIEDIKDTLYEIDMTYGAASIVHTQLEVIEESADFISVKVFGTTSIFFGDDADA